MFEYDCLYIQIAETVITASVLVNSIKMLLVIALISNLIGSSFIELTEEPRE